MHYNSSINKIILVGHLLKDARSHQHPGSGYPTLHFTLVTKELIKRQDGELLMEEIHQVKIPGQLIKSHAGQFVKGKQIFVEGKIKTRTATGAEGQKLYKTEIWAHHYQLIS